MDAAILEPGAHAGSTRARRSRLPRRLVHAAGVVGGVATLVVVLPMVSGAPWRAVAAAVVAIPAWAVAALLVIWLAGLVAHTLTLTAALPGLGIRRALLLSLTGSAVANVLPFGGAAGVTLNYRMTQRWGFTTAGFASYTLVTNLWNVLVKLALPVVLLPLVLSGLPTPPGLSRAITIAVAALPVVAGAAVVMLCFPGIASRLGERVERVRGVAAAVVASAWRRLSLGIALYTALLFLLLAACLHVTGASVALPVVLLAFCAERLATLVAITPGGLGVVEVGLAGALMLAPGAASAGVAGGVLLYRALTFGLEIPVGGLLLAAWAWRTGGMRAGRVTA